MDISGNLRLLKNIYEHLKLLVKRSIDPHPVGPKIHDLGPMKYTLEYSNVPTFLSAYYSLSNRQPTKNVCEQQPINGININPNLGIK